MTHTLRSNFMPDLLGAAILSPMRPVVYLYDIDGTLISTGGAGRRAIERAFAERFGRADACAHFSFAGMTDRAIARAGLRAIGLGATEAEITALLDAYVNLLAGEVARATNFRVNAGIAEALAACEARPACAIGLGTGNVVDGARVKLGHVQLF